MKSIRIFILGIILSMTLHGKSPGQERGFGAGIIIGEPTGISLKGWLTPKSAIDAGLAWSFVDGSSFHIHADYLLHTFDLFDTPEKIPFYYGIGGRIKTGDGKDALFGFRMVAGIAYFFRGAPFEIFLEVAPILDLSPATELRANAGIGARFFFK